MPVAACIARGKGAKRRDQQGLTEDFLAGPGMRIMQARTYANPAYLTLAVPIRKEFLPDEVPRMFVMGTLCCATKEEGHWPRAV